MFRSCSRQSHFTFPAILGFPRTGLVISRPRTSFGLSGIWLWFADLERDSECLPSRKKAKRQLVLGHKNGPNKKFRNFLLLTKTLRHLFSPERSEKNLVHGQWPLRRRT